MTPAISRTFDFVPSFIRPTAEDTRLARAVKLTAPLFGTYVLGQYLPFGDGLLNTAAIVFVAFMHAEGPAVTKQEKIDESAGKMWSSLCMYLSLPQKVEPSESTKLLPSTSTPSQAGADDAAFVVLTEAAKRD